MLVSSLCRFFIGDVKQRINHGVMTNLQQLSALFWLAFVGISGCTSYGGQVKQAFSELEAHNYQQAELIFKENLTPEGKDALLYYSELGMVHHLAGNYQHSNALLSKAEALAEAGYTLSISDLLASMLTSSRNMTYKGKPAEHIYYNYLKALNYLHLAQQSQNRKDREQRLDAARVEARRVDLKLEMIEREQGSYEQAKAQKETTFAQLLRIFDLLSGNTLEKDKLVFRQNAYANYLAGVIYEQYGELDNARISYEKSAQLYESGYADQLSLGKAIIEQAWLDTAMVMQKVGGYRSRLSRIKGDKLSPASIQRLTAATQRKGEVLIIEHAGWVPRLGELNFYLIADRETQELVLRPILVGSPEQQRHQFEWFFLLYADKGLLNLVKQYQEGGLLDVVTRFGQEKRVGLGPLWARAEKLGLIQAAETRGIRVTVPYYGPLATSRPRDSKIVIDGQSLAMIPAESPAVLGMQNQLLKSSTELNVALAREAIKQISAASTANIANAETGQLISGLLSLGASFTAQADTRSWLTLPHEIRIRRLSLPEGEYQLQLTGSASRSVQIQSGQLKIVEFRTAQYNTQALDQAY